MGPARGTTIPFAEYGRALQFLQPHWLRFLPLFALNLVSTGVTLAQPYLTKLLIDDGLTKRNFHSLVFVALWMAVCAALALGLGMLTTLLYTRVSALVLFDMRLAAFRKLQSLSPQFYASTKTGDIVSRLNNDIGELQKLSSDTLLSLPANILFLVGNAAMMFYLNPVLSCIGLALLPAGIWAMRRYQGRLRQQVKTLRQYSSDIGSFLIEAILGMRLLVSCNAQEGKNEEFRQHNERFVGSLMSMQKTSFLAGALPGAILTLSVAILFLYGGGLVIRGVLTLGSLMAFMAYHSRLMAPVQSLMGSYSALLTGSVSLGRVFELLDKKEDVVEDPAAPSVSFPCGSVEFENVSFRYRERGDVLENISFRIPPRSTSVLVGPSGAGKSTIVDLLVRFYDPVVGKITIAGHDLRKVRLSDLRAAVAVVEQTPFFFHCTIRENLAFAGPEASLAACEEAARRAEIHSFIDSLPNRYETVIGERALTLSAGQRHRLAIARALLRNPSVLILDEPTAALDPNAEFALAETLRALSQVCTVVIVTHRPALVTIADHVILLENGHVIESGPTSLLISGGSALSRHFRESLLPKTVVM